MKTTLALALTSIVAACGGGGTKQPDASQPPDSPKTPDAPTDTTSAVCTTTMLGAQDIQSPTDGNSASWGGDITTDLGDGAATQLYSLQFYHLSNTDLTMPVDLTSAVQADYATCDACVLVYTLDADGNPIRTYFQSGGTVTLSSDPVVSNTMMGMISGLSLVEVTIDDMYHSTLVPGGKCLTIGDVALNHDAVPNAWTCAHPAFNDGTNCDCMCGVEDPDCSAVANAPVVGCAANQACAYDACHDKATNDTCATAPTLAVGTPMDGNTFGATSNYDSGLEATTCDGLAQPGRDVAYKVALTAGTAYTVTLSNVAPTSYDPSISLVGPGAPACTAAMLNCLAGADAGFGGDGETFTYTPTATGNYFVIVDTYSASSEGGTFTLAVTQ